MRNTTRFAVVTALSLAAALAVASEPMPQAQPSGPDPLEPMKKLVGSWAQVGPDGKAGTEAAVTYRLTSHGSAILETMFPGADHEMVTIYHRDGGDLVLTHFCALGNQPRMRAKSVSAERIAFDFDGGMNVKAEKDAHMHSGSIAFLGPDEIQATWVSWQDGKATDQPVQLHLKRIGS